MPCKRICLFLAIVVCSIQQTVAQHGFAHSYNVLGPTITITKIKPVLTNAVVAWPASHPQALRYLNEGVEALPAGLYVAGLGFFCRKEWQLEKLTRIPVRVRLGTVAYTDYLEGK